MEGMRFSEIRNDRDITLTFPPTIVDDVIVVGAAYDSDTGFISIPSRTDVSVLPLVPGAEFSTVDWIQGPVRTPNADNHAHITNHPLLEGVDIPRTGISTRAGLLLTKTLLFAGEDQGGNPVFRAHDKTTGDIIAEIVLPASQTGLPMTYIHQGKQYIVLAVSGNGPTEFIALALPD